MRFLRISSGREVEIRVVQRGRHYLHGSFVVRVDDTHNTNFTRLCAIQGFPPIAFCIGLLKILSSTILIRARSKLTAGGFAESHRLNTSTSLPC